MNSTFLKHLSKNHEVIIGQESFKHRDEFGEHNYITVSLGNTGSREELYDYLLEKVLYALENCPTVYLRTVYIYTEGGKNYFTVRLIPRENKEEFLERINDFTKLEGHAMRML